jgi:hypothetical protein
MIDGKLQTYTAPMMLSTPPGRKLAYTHDEVSWVNVYAEESRDVEEIESRLLDKSDAWKENQPQIEALKKTIDHQDYADFLDEIGMTENAVQAIVTNPYDQIRFPDGSFSVSRSKSLIHGDGMFATAPFAQDDLIGPARIGGLRTPLGRFTNHSKQPNAKFVLVDDDILLVATQDIKGSVGSSHGDEITVDYRQAFDLVRSQV